MENVELGQTAKDRITGFSGIVTGVCHYMTGCSQALLVPKVKEDGTFVEAHWFDFQRLELMDVPMVQLDPVENAATPGPDLPPSRNY